MKPFDRLSDDARSTLREFSQDTGGFRCNSSGATSLAEACKEVMRLPEEKPVYSAVCPCCACDVMQLARANGHALAPLAWTCVCCGFTLMGLAVPVRHQTYQNSAHCYTCLEVRGMTEVRRW